MNETPPADSIEGDPRLQQQPTADDEDHDHQVAGEQVGEQTKGQRDRPGDEVEMNSSGMISGHNGQARPRAGHALEIVEQPVLRDARHVVHDERHQGQAVGKPIFEKVGNMNKKNCPNRLFTRMKVNNAIR